MRSIYPIAILLFAGMPTMVAQAQDLNNEVAELRQLIIEMKGDYEKRIADLEERLDKAERLANSASRDAEDAVELAEQSAIDQGAGSSSPNAFNPGIGAVLTGVYADQTGLEIGEAEVNFKASVDARYYGNLTFALAEGEAEVEEAWVQTTDLPAGFVVKGGRMFSAAGYLNSFHMHSDDFVDRPLPYQAFLDGRYGVDGVQLRWVAPTSLLFELGAELNWGGAYPATANGESSPGAYTLFAKTGGDVGISNSWQAGITHIAADPLERDGFTGDSDLTIVDFVWKWAPDGNPTVNNLKLQAEYFRRSEDGLFEGIDYSDDQSGWYVQGAWQFAPLWRAGLRFDDVDASLGRASSRSSVMVDYSPSEFSRLRLQYTNDNDLSNADDQWFLQYIMSLGAHGAHQF
jgi:hypothetical protein